MISNWNRELHKEDLCPEFILGCAAGLLGVVIIVWSLGAWLGRWFK